MESSLLEEFSDVFGPNLRAIGIGSAPPSQSTMTFLNRCFKEKRGVRVTNGYGATECGSIAFNGTENPAAEVSKLVSEWVGRCVSE